MKQSRAASFDVAINSTHTVLNSHPDTLGTTGESLPLFTTDLQEGTPYSKTQVGHAVETGVT